MFEDMKIPIGMGQMVALAGGGVVDAFLRGFLSVPFGKYAKYVTGLGEAGAWIYLVQQKPADYGLIKNVLAGGVVSEVNAIASGPSIEQGASLSAKAFPSSYESKLEEIGARLLGKPRAETVTGVELPPVKKELFAEEEVI